MTPELNITRDDIIATYEEGTRHANEYNLALQAKNRGLSLAEIGKRYGEGVRRRVKSGCVPRSVKGAEFLEDRGLLPMNMDNEKFRLFGLLTSIGFWRGTRVAGRKTYSNADIRIQSDEQEKLLLAAIDNLQIPYKDITCKSSGQRRMHLKGSTSRLMGLMGYELGAKTEHQSPLPVYIASLREGLITGKIDVKLAESILTDFVDTLLVFRSYIDGCVRINLNSFNSADLSEEQGVAIAEMFEKVHPNVPSALRLVQHQSTGTFYSVLTLKKFIKDRRELGERFRERIEGIAA